MYRKEKKETLAIMEIKIYFLTSAQVVFYIREFSLPQKYLISMKC